MPMDLQMARARGSFAVPENTFTNQYKIGCCRLKMETRQNVADESFLNRNRQVARRKPKRWPKRSASVKRDSSAALAASQVSSKVGLTRTDSDAGQSVSWC